MKSNVYRVSSEVTYPWILERHYAKRLPCITDAFGLYEGNMLVGIATYGVPASPYLCSGICGKKYAKIVLELNRVCIEDGGNNRASVLVSSSLKQLDRPRIIVSYADVGKGHIGYIYQATNWLYTGCTKERTDIYSGEGKHARHHGGDKSIRQPRTSKHRYVYFIGSHREIKDMLSSLNYPTQTYPKGNTERYDASKEITAQPLLL